MDDLRKHKQINGFTLIELMIGIAIAGVLLGIAIPAFNGAMERNRLTSYSNQLLGALTFARNEARSRRTEIRVCSSAAGAAADRTGSCDAGWIAGNPIILLQTSDNTVIRQLSTPPTGLELGVSAITFTWDSATSTLTGALREGEDDELLYDASGQLVSNASGTRARRLCVRLGTNETPYSLFQSGQIQIQPGAPCPAND